MIICESKLHNEQNGKTQAHTKFLREKRGGGWGRWLATHSDRQLCYFDAKKALNSQCTVNILAT